MNNVTTPAFIDFGDIIISNDHDDYMQGVIAGYQFYTKDHDADEQGYRASELVIAMEHELASDETFAWRLGFVMGRTLALVGTQLPAEVRAQLNG